jgi:hypothetical protein
MSLARPALRLRPYARFPLRTSSSQRFRQAVKMSSSSIAQKPEILSVEELKTDAKWLKMEKINWKDQDGKEVSPLSAYR